MKSLAEFNQWLDSIEFEKPVMKVTSNYWGDLELGFEDWDKTKVIDRTNWLMTAVQGNIDRLYDKELKHFYLDKTRAQEALYYIIKDYVISMAVKTSPAIKPKSTKLYRQIKAITYSQHKNDTFVNEMLPILNYWQKTTDTNETHNQNIQALLMIMCKKYSK